MSVDSSIMCLLRGSGSWNRVPIATNLDAA